MKLGDLVIPRKTSDWVNPSEEYIFLDPNDDPLEDNPSLPIKWKTGIIGTIIKVQTGWYSVEWIKVMTPFGSGYCFPSEVEVIN